MKSTDALAVTYRAMIAVLETDVRCTPDEQACLVAMDAKLAADATTKSEDQLVAQILMRWAATTENY